jgi:glycosyltransferase involved in cell wall biosynthesis
MNKKFSIIIPTYNCESLISSTLESIINQDDSLYECIIVDGLSNDDTIKTVEKYSNLNNNVRFISEKDKGIYDAMNKGIDLAKGEYLYFLGAGDTLSKDVLFKLNNEINDEDFIYGKVYKEHEGELIGEELKKSDLVYDLICHQAIFYKKNIFNIKGKYNLSYKVAADNIFNKKVFADDGLSKKFIDIEIANYLGGGVSQNYDIINEFKNEDIFIEELIKIFGENYLVNLYENTFNIKDKKIIAWGNGGEYTRANTIKSYDIEYFVKSYASINETFEDKQVKSREDLLNENKENTFILVYSACYYKEIRQWLESNKFVEFKNFSIITKEILKIGNKLGVL